MAVELKPKDLVVLYEQVAQAGQGLDPRERAGGELSQAAAGLGGVVASSV
ncbi:hypothetical protein [Xanthomonas campestris]|nr:hypothetical protein [Xanthomonas campestris]